MNPNTPPPSDDDLPDERELAALYARLPKSEPDVALDASVLAQATRALPVRRRPRWPVALGSAAVLVLAVGVAWQVRDTRPDTHVTAALPAPSFEQAAPSAELAPAPVPAPALPPPNIISPAKAKLQAQAAQPLARNTASGHVVLRTMRAPAPAPAPMISEPPTPAMPSSPPAPAAAPAPPEPTMPSGIALQSPGVQERATADTEEPRRASAPAAYLPKLDLDPDDRVGEIRRLLDTGHRDEALRRLHDLRERYPHYELPQDLRDLKP